MKKIIRAKLFSVFSSILFALALSSCDVGLGEEVDLEAPVISLRQLVSDTATFSSTELSGGNYVKKNITVTGTATDNKKVEAVQIWTKYANESSYTHLTNASLSGTEWTANITFPKEGAVFVRFLAVDSGDNSSPKSSRVVTLFVDETPPVASAWYIDREINGIQYNLRSLEALKALDENAAENKDAFQNEKFKICATVTEAMGISLVEMSIFDENGDAITSASGIRPMDGSSLYAPAFEVTKSMLSSLSSGKHYLQVRYTSEDIVEKDVEGGQPNKVENATIDGGYFIWWPESDIPRVSPSDLSETEANTINLHVKDSLSVTVFDDDSLKNAKCTLSGTGYTTTTKSWTATNSDRETVMAITMPDSPTTLTLKVEAEAADCDTQSSSSKSVTKTYTVNVTDDSSPLLLISEPSNNTTPAVTMGGSKGSETAKVTVKGQSYDTAGCKSLVFVWVPEGFQASSKLSAATSYLSSLSSYPDASATPATVSGGEYAGLKVWSVTLGTAAESSGFKKQDFSFTFDIMNDFVYNDENEKANSKYFLARLVRTDGGYSDTEYTLTADDLLPSIVGVNPADDMQIFEISSDLVLEFYGKKDSGLSMDEDKYKIELVGYRIEDNKPVAFDGKSQITGEYKTGIKDSSRKTYQATIPNEFLSNCMADGVKPKFQFYATDLFGNEGTAQYTVVLSSLPQLKSLSTTSSTRQKLGDEIIIYASFSDTVTVANGSKAYIKLAGISGTASNRDKAFYKEGSGSTTLQFSYKVQSGDSSDCLYIDNSGNDGPIVTNGDTTLASGAHLNTLDTTAYPKNAQLKPSGKTICIDGTPPQATKIDFSSTADSSKNKDNSGVTWLNEGKTLSATITMSEAVQIQGSPSFILKAGSTEIYLPFASKNDSAKTITFQKKISSEDADPEGELSYIPAKCIKNGTTGVVNSEEIVDSFGNRLSLLSGDSATSAEFGIDMTSPSKPTVTIKDASSSEIITSAKHNKPVLVVVSEASEKSTEFSTDAGSTWTEYSTSGDTNKISTAGAYTITARRTDWAGNVSDYADPISLDINTNFPSFTVECQNPDGNYKAGKKLTFKVQFANKVKVTGKEAYLQMSALKSGEKVGGEGSANEGKAPLTGTGSSKTTITTGTEVDSATFVYEVQDPDEFTLKVAKDGVVLTGFEDSYGIGWSNSSKLSEDYERSGIHCDGVAPKVTTMTPKGTKTTATDSKNVFTYDSANTIVLEFSEKVQKASGNLILRQVSGWSIPPVLTAKEFTTITNAVTSDEKEILSMQENGSDMEDSENLKGASVGPAQDKYHGTGQYVGPYKKSTQGLKLSGTSYVPDVSTKYVLAFDIGIEETSTAHPTGKTFQKGYADSAGYTNESQTGKVNVITPSTTRTADQLREVFESAGLHERVLDVTSSAVSIDDAGTKVTVKFPAGLIDTSDALPLGRKWELVIEKGAFMDMTGNEFGAESNGVLSSADAVQKSGTQYTVGSKVTTEYTAYSGSWARARDSISDGSAPVVLIDNESNEYFWSSGCATPVIRVDRYSYRLGTIQSDSSGNTTAAVLTDGVVPTGYVRVRIDCETPGATIKYDNSNKTTNSRTDTTFNSSTDVLENGYSDAPCNSYITSTTDLASSTFDSNTPSTTYSRAFACGSGSYKQSCKQYVIAQATANSSTSEKGLEGVFQTVARFNTPIGANWTNCADCGSGKTDVSIRGTTGWAGEPNISPFPLRDSQIASPFLCRTFRESTQSSTSNSKDYYWVSYEILVGTSFSNYSWHKWQYYDWAKNWGYMRYGEFTNCTGMKNWGYN